MSKTTFSDKCNVLGDLWLFYREQAQDNEAWAEFFAFNDIALPLSYMISVGLADPLGDAEQYINETWDMFCEYIEIDPEGEYHSIADAFEASDRPPIMSE